MNIAVLIAGHLSTAPRPTKEASALARAGHRVTVFGAWFDEMLVARDRELLADAPFEFVPAVDLRTRTMAGRLQRLRARATGRTAREVYRRMGRFSPSLFGYGVKEAYAHARRANADLTIVHSEGGLWVGRRLQRKGQTVGVDFEDWFSEDLLPEDRIARPVARLKQLEGELARTCGYVTAASRAMSDAIAAAYDAPRPTPIYNSFPTADRARRAAEPLRDRRSRDIPSLHWFSQTIGPGRGLEALMLALPAISVPVEVHIRGALSGVRRAWLEELIPAGLQGRVHLHETVSNGELPARIAEHDIGLALEVPSCPNKDLTVSNKMFQYLESGLAVVATDTVGQREILGRFRAAGLIVPPDDALALGDALNTLVTQPAVLASAKAAARCAADAIAWENQEPVLVELAERAVGRGKVSPRPGAMAA